MCHRRHPGPSRAQALVPFIACGDLCGFDADANYPLQPLHTLQPAASHVAGAPSAPADCDDGVGAASGGDPSESGGGYVYHEPVQLPTTPAYRAYLQAVHAAHAAAGGSGVVAANKAE